MSGQGMQFSMLSPSILRTNTINTVDDILVPPCIQSSDHSFTEQPPTPKREHSFYNGSRHYINRLRFESFNALEHCSLEGSTVAAAAAVTTTTTTTAAAAAAGQQQVPCIYQTSACTSPNASFSSSKSSNWSSSSSITTSSSNDSDQESTPLLQLVQPIQRFADEARLGNKWTQQQQGRRLRQQQQHSDFTNSILQLAVVLVSCLGWVAISSTAILINKHCMVDLGFHFPAAVAALGMVGTTLFSFLACVVLHLVPCKASVSPYFFFTRIFSTAFFTALSFQAGNTAYLHLSVAFVQMLKAFTPVCTMLCGFLFNLERPSRSLIAAVGFICCGVVVSSYGELNFSVLGVLAMLISVIAEGLRIVMMQHLLASKKFHPIEAWLYLGPACCIWLVVLIGVFEIHQIQDVHGWDILASYPLYFVFAAVAGFAVNALAMLVIKLASALTLKVLGVCKDIGLVTYGVVLLGEHVSGLQMGGYSLALVGVGCYNYVKLCHGAALAAAAAAATTSDKANGQQQQRSDAAAANGKGKSLRTLSPLRKKQGLIGTTTVAAAATTAAAAAGDDDGIGLSEPLLSAVRVEVLV